MDEFKRCTATSTRTGERCWKARIPGASVCDVHGGSVGRVKDAAARRVQEQQAMALAERQVAALDLDVSRYADPFAALEFAVSYSCVLASAAGRATLKTLINGSSSTGEVHAPRRVRPEGTSMVNIAEGSMPVPSAKTSGRRRAAGIYGAIITAAILDTAGGRLPTDALVIAVVATLVVYWLAEEYAELLGEQVEGGVVPTWATICERLAATWPMVSTAYLPLLALVLARVAGATALAAANVGLVTVVVLLMVHAWAAGRSAQLRGRRLLTATSIAAGLGLAMIALKDVVLIHLH